MNVEKRVRELLDEANRADVGLIVVVVDFSHNKTGVLSNLGERFPQSDAKALILDALETTSDIVQNGL